MMKRLATTVTFGLGILVIYLFIILSLLLAVEMGPATAQILSRPAETVIEQQSEPAEIIKRAPARDITKQRFAPLETDQQ